ncbi:MAG: flagellar biosynthesis protein FlhA [Treponema sp.]|nr:flagellar biosynthesis protein FlhA [Treponema sp.]
MADLENSNSRNPLKFLKDNLPSITVITIVIAIILPLPTFLLDAFMAINLVFALLILLVVLNAKKPTEISIFPSLLLVSTVFGLGLNIASTRLILTKGANFDGRMIKAFSNFVVGTSGTEGLVVGILIFIVIIVVQLIVITKGATRIAEVAARFTLDALQVKIMGVEAEYSSGAIDEAEAKRQKAEIRDESNFYGAMDGASKFISGNVKAGIFIIVLEMLGGFIIGSVLYGEQNVVPLYIGLAIGDGLVTQLPALLISTAMGIVVTRASAAGDFSDQLIDQLFNKDAKIYWICAAVLVLLSALPGFPWYVLVPIALLVAYNAYRLGIKQKAIRIGGTPAGPKQTEPVRAPEIPPVVPLDILSLDLGYGLVTLVEREKGAELLERISGVRNQTALDLGFRFPKVRIQDNAGLEPSEYCFKLKGVNVGRGKIRTGYYLCLKPGNSATDIEGEKTVDPAFGLPAIWVAHERRDEAERAGYTIVDPPSIIATHLTEIVRRSAADILGLEDTQVILNAMRENYPALVEEVMRTGENGMRVLEIQKIFQGLLRERVSIRNKVTILEAIAEYAPVSRVSWVLVEKVRQALASQICQQYADYDRKVRVLGLEHSLEQRIIDSAVKTQMGIRAALEPALQQAWIKAVCKAVAAVRQKGWMPVIVCSEAARYLVKNSTDRELPDLAVLSMNEISPEFVFESVGMIKIEAASTE